jgi:hypothetical protein
VAQNNLDFNIIAHTQGMEQVANLINRVGALEAETKKLAAANTTLATSTNTVISNGKRYNNALDAQSKAIRNNRMGVSQLGMQFSDLATSISTGASPVQAFNQQIGQIGYALSLMTGRLGGFGRLLAGPGSIALIGATLLMSQFKGKTEETTEVTANFGDYALATFQSIGEKISTGLIPAIEAIQPALIALQPVIDSVNLFFKNLGDVGEMVANGLIRTFVIAVNSIAILASNSFSMVAELVVGTINVGVRAVNSLIAMVESSINKIGSYVNQVSDIFSLGFRVGEANFGRLEMVTNKWAGTSKKAAAEVGAAFKKTLGTDFIQAADIGERADALAAQRAANNIKKKSGGAKDTGSSADKAKKQKPEFSMLGFYEEYFAKEFEKTDESIAKTVETQIKSLIDTIPDLAKVSDEMLAIQTRNDELNNSFKTIGMTVSDAFKGMLTGAMSWKDGMRSLIASVIDELWKLFVVQQIVGLVSSALGGASGMPGKMGTASDALKLVQVPGFANGTTYAPGGMALVGERGPELVNLPRGSQVIPNHKMRGGSGGGINISVDARGASDPAAVRAQVQQGILEAAPAIIAAAESRTVAGLRRPRLGGVMQ